MPWCDECAKFWNPPSLRSGACPKCGATLDSLPPVGGPPVGPPEVRQAPWHFKLMVVALILYLAFRAYQGVFWVVHHV